VKACLLWLTLAATGLVAAAEPSMRAQLAEEIHKQVVYAPPPPVGEAPAALPAGDEDVVVLEPLVTTTRLDAFAHKIDERQQKEKAELFSLLEGGVFFKHEGKLITAEVKLRHDPEHDGLSARHVNWDILSLSW